MERWAICRTGYLPSVKRGNSIATKIFTGRRSPWFIYSTKKCYSGLRLAADEAIGLPHCVRDVKNLDSHSPIIRAGFCVAHFVFFVGAIGVARRSKAAFAQLKAGIEPSGEHRGGKSGNGHNAAGIIEQRPGQMRSGKRDPRRESQGLTKIRHRLFSAALQGAVSIQSAVRNGHFKVLAAPDNGAVYAAFLLQVQQFLNGAAKPSRPGDRK